MRIIPHIFDFTSQKEVKIPITVPTKVFECSTKKVCQMLIFPADLDVPVILSLLQTLQVPLKTRCIIIRLPMATNEAGEKRADLPDDATWEEEDDGSEQEREALHEVQRGRVEGIEEAAAHQGTGALHTGYGGKQGP